jgi:hypothetical protein
MRTKQTIYMDRQGGTWVYWTDTEEGKWRLSKESVDKMLASKNYRLVIIRD